MRQMVTEEHDLDSYKPLSPTCESAPLELGPQQVKHLQTLDKR